MEEPVDFTKPWKHSDVTFVVEGKKIWANKSVLSMWSSVMDAMFTGDFQVCLPNIIRVLHRSF